MKKMRQVLTISAAAIVSSVTLAACGTTDSSDNAPEVKEATSTDCEKDDTETSSGPVTVTDDFGRKVTLDKPAKRVIPLEWQQIEDMLTLCVTPVAAADVKGYTLWDTAEKLPADTVDVGTRQEPNAEAIIGADPELIIVEAAAKDDPVIKQFEKYDVPVLATIGADAKDPIQRMKDTFNLLAEATGREERAEVVLQEFDDHLDSAKDEVADADMVTKEFVFFDGWVDGGNVAIRPFGQGSMVADLGEELGLKNAWTGPVDKVYGLGQTDIEGMVKVGDANLFRSGTTDPSGDIYAELDKNSVWSKLPAVKEDRYQSFPEGIWSFGGPRSAQQIIDAYVGLITKS